MALCMGHRRDLTKSVVETLTGVGSRRQRTVAMLDSRLLGWAGDDNHAELDEQKVWRPGITNVPRAVQGSSFPKL